MKKYLFIFCLAVFALPKHTYAATNSACQYLPILMYHHIRPNSEAKTLHQTGLNVSPENFDHQLSQLSKAGYSFLSLDQIYDILVQKQPKPAKAIALTIDDGYKDNYTNALPILKKYNAHASLMLATGLVGGGDFLSWENVKEMKNSGVFSIYNHTWSHYALSKKDPTKANWEIQTAQKQLEEQGVAGSKIIAYPYGSYDTSTLSLVSSLGYKLGITTHPGTILCSNKILELPRKRVGNSPNIKI